MRMILTIITSLFIATSAQADMPEVCQAHFGKETFDNGRSTGEVISLYHAVQKELRELIHFIKQDEVEPTMYFFALFFDEQVRDAIRLHSAYQTAQKNLTAGNELASYYDSSEMWIASMEVGPMVPHANILVKNSGFDDQLARRITSLTECFDAVIKKSADSYTLVFEQLTQPK